MHYIKGVKIKTRVLYAIHKRCSHKDMSTLCITYKVDKILKHDHNCLRYYRPSMGLIVLPDLIVVNAGS